MSEDPEGGRPADRPTLREAEVSPPLLENTLIKRHQPRFNVSVSGGRSGGTERRRNLVSSRFAASASTYPRVGALPCPAPLEAARVAMAWHPRFDADPGHASFRNEVRALARPHDDAP